MKHKLSKITTLTLLLISGSTVNAQNFYTCVPENDWVKGLSKEVQRTDEEIRSLARETRRSDEEWVLNIVRKEFDRKIKDERKRNENKEKCSKEQEDCKSKEQSYKDCLEKYRGANINTRQVCRNKTHYKEEECKKILKKSC